jgi:hypothetical protein
MTDSDREQEIARRAYALWEEEGRPEGREKEHWTRAEAEVAPGGAAELPEHQAPGEEPVAGDAGSAAAAMPEAMAQPGEGVADPAAPLDAEMPMPRARTGTRRGGA